MSARRPEAWVLAVAALLFLWQLGGHDLWAPDEPYFGEGAREMVVEGHWLVPHVNGRVTTDKPPLFFWTIAVLSLPGGEVTPWTARLPSALAALGTLLLVIRLGRRLDRKGGGGRLAWLAPLVLSVTLMFWEKARWAQIDAMLCLLIWVALSAFEAWRAGDARGRPAGLLFWLAAGLAVLAKGPVGLLLPLGIALVTLATDRRLRDWRGFAPVTGPLLFAVVVGAWIVAATFWSAADYSVWSALREHLVGRAVHGMHHVQPPWYYLEVLPLHLLPWSGLVPGALVLAWRRRRQAGDRWLLVVVSFVVLFFSISTEKRDLYVLPAMPAFALLVARLVDALAFPRAEEPAPPVGRRWLFGSQVAVGGLLALAGAVVPVVARGRDEAPYWVALVLAAVLLATGLATLWACRRSRPLYAALAPAAGFAAGYLFAVTFLYPALEPRKSARPFSLKVAAATEASRAAGLPVLAYDLANVPEAFAFFGDGLYTVETEDLGAVAEHLRRPEEVWAVVRGSALERLPEDVREQLVVVAEDRLSRRDVALVTNRP
ncbi:MAG TPA: glycosyltransferase family 39 protein [Thermoanaerobaculia bacterium]|nr:glycosyltransferase family 39 protein [Thermoanaerobaculia bacterium]